MNEARLQILFNTFPDFKSEFADDRRREWESMEVLKELKSVWVLALGMEDQIFRQQEEIVREYLEVTYDAKNIVFDRQGKQIIFEFDFEEIRI